MNEQKLDIQPGAALAGVPVAGTWAADPFGRFTLRWWDGAQWTDQVSTDARTYTDPPTGLPVVVPQQQQVVHQHFVTSPRRKDVGIAFLLTFFFGGFGMLYSTIAGGLIMIAVDFFICAIGFVTLGIGWILFLPAWIVQIAWAVHAASKS